MHVATKYFIFLSSVFHPYRQSSRDCGVKNRVDAAGFDDASRHVRVDPLLSGARPRCEHIGRLWVEQPMPVIGFLDSTSPDAFGDRLRAFHQGLKETGRVEGENVAIEYRWANNQRDRLLDRQNLC
jgi:hypothetical protein